MQGFNEESYQDWRRTKAHIDVIVVGSGVGGLTSASLLAQSGLTVLVLERASEAG